MYAPLLYPLVGVLRIAVSDVELAPANERAGMLACKAAYALFALVLPIAHHGWS